MASREPHVEPDDNTDDSPSIADSALGSDGASSTGSLSSSVLNYQYENGRRYHAFREGAYVLPNDEVEQDRLDLTHHILAILLGGNLYRAPITEPQRILDVGTGTGAWAIEIADTFPNAQVIATDLSPIQPKWVPPNLEFQVDDCESEWSHSKPFDFIHLRILGGSIADWPKLIANIYANLAPGGYVEIADWETYSRTDDNSLADESALNKWQTELNDAAVKFGREMRTALKLKDWVTDAGFVDIHNEVIKAPLSPWAKDPKLKEVGVFMQQLFSDSLEPYSLALYTRVLGWSSEQVQAFLTEVRKDAQNRKHHVYTALHRVWARKPREGEAA